MLTETFYYEISLCPLPAPLQVIYGKRWKTRANVQSFFYVIYKHHLNITYNYSLKSGKSSWIILGSLEFFHEHTRVERHTQFQFQFQSLGTALKNGSYHEHHTSSGQEMETVGMFNMHEMEDSILPTHHREKKARGKKTFQ